MDYEFPFTEMLEKLIEYLNKHKFEVEDSDMQYFLHFSSLKLEEIRALLGMIAEFATMIKIFTKLPT